eukprot:GEMP01033917.1.p1 GENE.GEMP01033917.1~~GEMP01033917.1.p1  ORF type:complete len:478 (+),score=128.62 GEMP01033917.1:117-1550(+)
MFFHRHQLVRSSAMWCQAYPARLSCWARTTCRTACVMSAAPHGATIAPMHARLFSGSMARTLPRRIPRGMAAPTWTSTGVRAFATLRDNLQLLGLEQSASLADVRKAYILLAKRHHPDAGGNGITFIRVKDAYEDLMAHFNNGGSSTSSSSDGFDPFGGERNARNAWASREDKHAWYEEEDDAEDRFWEQCSREWNKGRQRHEGNRRNPRQHREERQQKKHGREERRYASRGEHGKVRRRQEPFPPDLRVVGGPAAGIFCRVNSSVNGQPAYERKSTPFYILFYSKKYKDWKLAQSLQDNGECEVFGQALMGEYYNENGSITRIESEEDWSTPDDWSTECLLHWCKARDICTDDKFCKEDLVALVKEIGPTDESMTDSDSSDDEYDEGPREWRDRGQHRWKFQIASRMKTDGSFRKPATMNPKNTLFGNRIEHTSISDNSMWRWLREEGDRSRVYAVWYNREYCYSIIWKNKKWRNM